MFFPVFTISFAIAKKKVNPGKIFGMEIRKKSLNNRTLASLLCQSNRRGKKRLGKKA
jgi:hypothetical protein